MVVEVGLERGSWRTPLQNRDRWKRPRIREIRIARFS
jgi:hypothetical protein